jgi:CubicO group peptidase (beta-lactamase class C family)/nicotinamidase-related amidase/type 1 glutamine amidotransferase
MNASAPHLVILSALVLAAPAGPLTGSSPEEVEALVQAAIAGDLEGLERALKEGAPVDARSRFGLTALQVARIRGWKEAAELLIAKGADPDVPFPPEEEVIDRGIRARLLDPSPAVSLLAAKDGKVLFKKGYGFACLEHRVPATPATRFRIGSVTKQFTAAAILELEEAGKLGLKDKLSRFFLDYPRGGEVTIHHLLTHTSGIQSYTGLPGVFTTLRLSTTPEELIASFRDLPYEFDPGARWSYNNSGYFLLGRIIEQVSGRTYGDYLEAALFAPAGMKESGVHDSRAIIENEAYGYSWEDGALRKAENWDMSRAGGAGALYSTVEDLHLWNETLFGGRLLEKASLEAAFTPVATAEDDPGRPKEEGYGYGWGISKVRGLKEISHGGGLHGFTSFLLRIPEEKFTAVVLVNASPPPPGLDAAGIAHELTELYLWRRMEDRPSVPAGLELGPEALEAYTGRYDYGSAFMTLTREGNRLFAQLAGQPRFEVFPRGKDRFFWKVVEAEVEFVRDDKGQVVKALHRQGGLTINAAKLPEVAVAKVDPALYDAYAGRYDFAGGKWVLTVRRDGDRLLAQLTGQPELEILPLSETTFSWKDINAQITFVRGKDGKVTGATHEQGGRKLEVRRIERTSSDEDAGRWPLELRRRVAAGREAGAGSGEGGDVYRVVTEREAWDPKRTAVIVCDMWDLHHSINATRRGGEMAPRMNAVIERARSQGATIIHAPSSCMETYKSHPARRNALATPRAKSLPADIGSWCHQIPSEEKGEYPIDQSDGGEDDDPGEHQKWAEELRSRGRDPRAPWKSQTDALKISDTDFISDSGEEVWSILEHRGLENVILVGVHTNMCVLGRPFGLRQMAKNKKRVVLVRDMTDTMYNPLRAPYVSHFTGTDLIVEHIEKFVCPTITSDQLLGGEPFRFAGDTRLHAVVVMAETEYGTEKTLPRFAVSRLGKDFRLSWVHADPAEPARLPGIDVLAGADLLILSVRRRLPPAPELAVIRDFIARGKPVVGVRTASHAFTVRRERAPEGRADWPEFDHEVIGGNYTGHHGSGPEVAVERAPGTAGHAVLEGVDAAGIRGHGSLYQVSPLAASATALLVGSIPGKPAEPVAWVNRTRWGGKVFYTSLGHPADFEEEAVNRLLENAVRWAARKDGAGE